MSNRKWIDVVQAYRYLPNYIRAPRLEELVTKLRRGDRSVEHEIIRGHLRLGLRIIQDKNYSVADDLIGEMEYAVTKAVWMAGRGALKDNNITAYIASYIRHHINEYIKSNRLVTAPPRTIRDWNKKNKKTKLFHRISIIEGEPYKTDDSGQTIRLQSVGVAYHIPTVDDGPLEEVDIRDILDKVTFSNSEKKIIDLREQGYNIEEIGKVVGYSKSMVHKLLHDIEDRFDDYMEKAE